MKFLLISPKNRTVYNFRGELIREIQKKGYEVLVTGPDRTDVDRIEALGARFLEIPMNKTGTSILGDLGYCKKLFSLIRAEKPTVTLGYTVKPVVYGAIAARIAGVENINSLITGGGYTFISSSVKAKVLGFLVRCLYRIGLHASNHVIFQNSDDRQEFCARKLAPEKNSYVVNGSGVDLSHFQPTPLPDTPTFFMLSRLLKSKGVGEYLEAARIVKAEFPQTRFLLLGKYEYNMQDGLDKDYVESFVRDGTIERFDETSDVRPYYGMCSVYVLPSYREGMPRTVLEAMAMGRPILTTDTYGCRDTVREGETGFLVPIKDVSSLTDKMLWFLEHPEQIPLMGGKSRTLAEERFDVKKINADMLRYMQL
ncbi:MAG: glycosyltransferase family 4 protein [Clostridia bacterium]|nr:glycosyltransferase family 4 protein [Clostridia bacterium]